MIYVHDDVIKWKHFPCYWPFVHGIHRSTVNSLHKGQWRGALMFSLICAGINGWVNTHEAGDLRRYYVHYDVIVMFQDIFVASLPASHYLGQCKFLFNWTLGWQTSEKFMLRYASFLSRKYLLKCSLINGVHFVLDKMSTCQGHATHICVNKLGHHWFK